MPDLATPAPPVTREELADIRKQCGMEPATFNYQDPTPEMHTDPLWNAIWDEIKTWDINIPTEYAGYSGATGNHVTAIYLAIMNRQQAEALRELFSPIDIEALSAKENT